eukprot:GGOE01000762.1.p1 GENE.GGOE01000762.1~~GGOE01000762.1.p1  ORF type:complete len:403 (+),score=95.76 GGOE01000762.1:45-1211(+)
MWKKEQWTGCKPLSRSGCAGCCLKSKLVLFGGNACSSGENFLSDTYVFDLSTDDALTCTEVDVAGTAPFPMDRHSAVAHGNEMWVFGGDRGWTLTNKLWKFNIDTCRWQEGATHRAPSARRGHSAVKCEGRKSMIVFGGMEMTHVPFYLSGRLVANNVSVNDTWELMLANDPPVWEHRTTPTRPPPPRRGHSAVLFEADADNSTTRMYVFGGYCEHEAATGIWYNDLWRFVVEKSEWQNVTCWGDVPRARVGHAAARTNRDSFVIFGGGSQDNNENTLFECHENGLWRRIEPLAGTISPSPRSYVTVATMGYRLLLHGGCNNDRELDCLYSLSLDFNTLFPRSLFNLLAEYVILHHVPYKAIAQDAAPPSADPSDRTHTSNSQCGSRR